ncbi:HD domain-containing protein [Candidatus Parcubacteria bacterium]|nr:HD domain-containing protein [Candidatus Parcubacteria bacterium]
MNKADISLLNKNNIKKGRLIDLMPEFYELKELVESNYWHNKETVFNHILSVLDNLEKIIRNLREETKQVLNEIVEKKSRKDLLRVAALFHDIGKKETMIDFNGFMDFPGHEQKGAEKAVKILKRFNLSKKESKIVADIIKNHSLAHEIITPENSNFQKEYKNFRKKFLDSIYLELILLAFADTIGSYLKKTKPTVFRYKIDFYKKELKNLPPRKMDKL